MTWTPPSQPPGPNRTPVYVALVAAVVVVAVIIGGAMWMTRKTEAAPAVTASSTPAAGLATCRFGAALSDAPSLPKLKRLIGLAGASGVPELVKVAAANRNPTYREAWDAQTAIGAWCSAHHLGG